MKKTTLALCAFMFSVATCGMASAQPLPPAPDSPRAHHVAPRHYKPYKAPPRTMYRSHRPRHHVPPPPPHHRRHYH